MHASQNTREKGKKCLSAVRGSLSAIHASERVSATLRGVTKTMRSINSHAR